VFAGPERGLQAEYFAADQPAGDPVMSVVDDRISTEELQARWHGVPPDTFSVRWFGYLTVTRPGRYTFALTSDDAGFLWVDGRQVIDNGGRHGAATETVTLPLTRGPHAVLIEFTQYTGDYAIGWQWGREGRRLRPVPAWVLSPQRTPLWRMVTARAADLITVSLLLAALAAAGMIVARSPGWSTRHPQWSTLALFAVLAVIHTWPLASDPAHLARHDNRDTMLNEWIVAWVVHQAPRDPVHLFDANIFYPERRSLAFSEAMLPQAAMAAPVFALGGSPVLAYGLLLIAGFALTGWSMCLVVKRWTGEWTAGIVSGAIFAFSAHALTRIPHLQAQHVEVLPPALLALDALLVQPNARRAIGLAAWSALQATTSVYLLAMTFFAIAAGVLARPADWLGRKFNPFARAFAIAGATASIVLVPFLLPYYYASQDQGLTRSLSDAARYSATWMDYLSTPSRIWYPLWSHRFFVGTALFPGAVGLVLSLVALIRGNALRDPRARMCLVIGVVGIALSFGPKLPGYAALYDAVPILKGIRATARFGYLATLAVAVLAGFGTVVICRITPHRLRPAVAAGLVLAASSESLVAPLGLSRFEAIPPIYSRLPRDPGTRVVEIPFYGPRSAQFHAAYMLNSTAHWRPLLNGYSGFQPGSFYAHAAALQGFPDDTSLTLLRQLGITHVFVHTTQVTNASLARIQSWPQLQMIDTYGAIALYRLN
jgi:hypothetical protein